MERIIGHWLSIAAVLQLGALAGSAQIYTYSGSETVINLTPGYYNITAYGAQGGSGLLGPGGLGAEMSAKFYFSGNTTLTLLVGGAGARPANTDIALNGGGAAGGGGGGSFVVNGSTPLVVAGGGGGGSYFNGGISGSTGTSGQAGGYSGAGSGGTNGNGGGSGNQANGGGGFYSSGGTGPFGGAGGGSFLSGGYGGAGGSGGNPIGPRLGGSGGYGGGGGGTSQAGGGGGGYSGGGGGGNVSTGGGSWGRGGGGGSIIDSSAIAVLATVSGVASPDGSPNGEIIITAVPVPRPTIVCPEPLTLECTNGSAAGTLEAGVMDTNGLPLQVIWTVDGKAYQTNDIPSGGTITASNVTFTATFGAGGHTVVISASNGQSTPASCSTTVTVGDTLPPRVSHISATPGSLWPPNHRMVPVSVVVDAVDNCDPSTVAHITKVISNEPQNPVAPDWEITGPLSVNLRAERLGGKGGRIYTIFVECEDSSGNIAHSSVDVSVPHDHR